MISYIIKNGPRLQKVEKSCHENCIIALKITKLGKIIKKWEIVQKMTKDDKIGPDFKKMRSVMKKIASF